MRQETRAMAFHHENGFHAQLELAKAFAGEEGRVATMEDIVHARLSQSDPHHYVWWNTFVTGTYLYTGKSQGGSDLLIIKHGDGPETVPAWKMRGWEPDSRHGKYPMIATEDFTKLESGHFGDVAIIELAQYVNRSSGNSATNRYRTEQALEDPIIMAVLGREAEAFLKFQDERMQEWLADNPQKDRDEFIAMITRLYNIYGNGYGERDHYSLSVGYGRVYNLTLDRTHFYNGRDGEPKSASGCEIGVAVNSGIDDLIFTPYYVVGVRGKEPITTVQPSLLNMVGDVKKNWPTFVQPAEEVSDDAFLGNKPDGSRERPYYLLTRWGSEPMFTGRITDDGKETTAPEFRILDIKDISEDYIPYVDPDWGPPYPHQYPYKGLWEAGLAHMPEGANALTFHGAEGGDGGGKSSVSYHYITVSEDPFWVLMQCGDRLFTQYADEHKVSGQPHRLVEVEHEYKTRKVNLDGVRLDSTSNQHKWPYYQYLASKGPKGANAMLIDEHSWPREVRFFRVTLGNQSFRRLSDIRADFDWQLERREAAGLLVA